MALVVRWYDFICFGIVGLAFFGSLLLIWWREKGERRSSCGGSSSSMYESLVSVSRPEPEECAPRAGHLCSSQLWNSCWAGLHPGWLLGIRFLSFATLSGFLVWDILEYSPSIYVYYTEWTFTLVVIYFAIATIVSAHGCVLYYSQLQSMKSPTENGRWQGKEILPGDIEPRVYTIAANIADKERVGINMLLERAGFWGYLMQISFQTCAGAVVLTDIVFWLVIVPFLPNVHLQLNLLMGCIHTLNAVFLLLDTSINSLPFPWFRLAYFVLWSCCYVIFLWVIHACGFTWWPYPFLELSTPWAPLWYLCLAVIHIPCYGFYWLVVSAKTSIFPRLFPRAFVKY
ncbi:hypothetical protein ACH5RR_040869 [Cinchona calisaya]|uniref:Uncharacterized protein n=1 Tax=Cinchona calisaya TaxID=153742 RepID=A0ABD2XX52_9GENT